MEYRLLYSKTEIGKIIQHTHDFPNSCGLYELNKTIKDDDGLINQYIKYSVEASQIIDIDEPKWQEFVEKEESRFIDLIESENWKLIDEEGKSYKILIPIFCNGNEITWRWSF